MANLRFAFRMLFKTPFVTTVAVLSLALGIGSTAAIFSVFNEILLRSVPVPSPDRLVNFASPGPMSGSTSCDQEGDCDEIFSYPMFRDLEKAQTVFTGIAGHRLFGANLSYQGQTTSTQGLLVSGSYFQVLQLTPALGRLIGPADDTAPGEVPVAVLSHAYWVSRFGASPAALNQPIVVNGRTLTIVGVAPRGFDGTTVGARPDVFVPITLRDIMQPFAFNPAGRTSFTRRDSYWVYLFARLKPGTSLDAAASAIGAQYHGILNDVDAPLQHYSAATMARFRAKPLLVTPGGHGQSQTPREARKPLAMLLAVTGLVLLIACANIANLLLARSASRAGEMAVRLSIGASRWQLVRQLLTESLLLSLLGGLAGVLVARWTLAGIVALLPAEAAKTLSFDIDATVLAFAAALTVGTGLLFGLFPALHSTNPDLVGTLKGQSGQPSGSKSAKWFRTVLATTQIAISMMLLASAGLFVKSLINVSRVDLGIRTDHMVTFGLSPELNGYTSERSRALFERLETDLAAIPGVTGVTTSLVPVLSGSNWGTDVAVQGFTPAPDTDANARFSEVGAGYFGTMGIPLMSGREFTEADRAGAPKVAIVNEEFAKRFGLGHDAVGKLMGTSGAKTLDITIVGVAQNAKYAEVKQQIPPLFYTPYRQDDRLGSMQFYVRTAADPAHAAPDVTAVVKRADPNLPVEELKTLDRQIRDNTFLDRMMSTLSAAFASLATLLAAVGLYGVLAYTVTQRTREFGLRMALGAAPGRVRGMVLKQVGWMIAVGGVAGLAAALKVVAIAQSALYGMTGADPAVLIASSALLAVVALVAGFVPAYRASTVDPMSALRYQ